MYGHTDQQKYEIGLRTCRNTIVTRQGVTSNRNGTEFVASSKQQAAVRLLRFEFSSKDALVMEFGNQYVRFIVNGALVTVSGVAAWSNVTAYVIGDLVSSAGINYYCIQANTNQVPTTTAYWYPLIGNIYEVPTPYQNADLFGLNIAQSADVVTIVHQLYPPAQLKRFALTHWEYDVIAFGPAINPPTAAALSGTVSLTGNLYEYAVTAISATGEESYVDLTGPHALKDPTLTDPHTVTWTPPAGAVSFNVYISINKSAFFFLSAASGTPFTNTGAVTLNNTRTPPANPDVFSGAGNYPGVAGYYQQRAMFANSINQPNRVWGSRTGRFTNFSISSPLQEDDAVIFDLVSATVDTVQQLIDLGRLLVATDGAEWLADGDTQNVLSPTSINARIGSYNGSAPLRTLKVDFNILYVQSLGTTIRKLTANILYGYYTFAGEDLTLFASHLFDGFQIVDWDWAQQPNYTVWAVRSDGTLLGLTLLPEQQLQAWHRHDTTNGKFESIAVIPENGAHAVYLSVFRVIAGTNVRYIERMTPRLIRDDLRDPKFMDSSLSFDGTDNTNSNGLRISGGGPDTPAIPFSPGPPVQPEIPAQSGWGIDVLLTLTADTPQFGSDAVGDAYFITGPNGELVRFTISVLVSSTVVQGYPDIDVPVSLQGVDRVTWARAVKKIGGLNHLVGETVAIYGDGAVVGSPNNPDYPAYTVANDGTVTMDEPHAVVCVGLPYLSDVETLDIDMPHGPSAKAQRMNVTAVGLMVDASRGIFIGGREPKLSTTDGLVEMKLRDTVEMGLNRGEPVSPVSKYIEQAIESEWNSNGRVFIRQIDPVPLTILSISALGNVPVGA
jgi:hypothetical protein